MKVRDYLLVAAMVCCTAEGNMLEFGPQRGDTECIDKNRIIRDHNENWFVASTCENCLCESGLITCEKVKRPCPESPHLSCIEIPGGCCPSWDCSAQQCKSRKLGEIWLNEEDPCKPYKCTENGVRRTIKECPILEPEPDTSCFLDSDGNCCLRWQCLNCPDPESFGRQCIQYHDQCNNHTECEYGEICCLVKGCGRECMTPCLDSEGTSRGIGEEWVDPQRPNLKWACREDGIDIVAGCDSDYLQDEDDHDDMHNGMNSLSSDGISILDNLRSNWPVKDLGHFKRGFSSFLSQTRIRGGTVPSDVTTPVAATLITESGSAAGAAGINANFGSTLGIGFGQTLPEIQAFADQFNWTAIVPLLSKDITQDIRVAFDTADAGLQQRLNRNRLTSQRNDTLRLSSPSLKHQVAFRRTDPISTKMANLGHIIGMASEKIVSSFAIPRVATSGLSLLGESQECNRRFSAFQRPNLASVCNNEALYRNLDGSCNNPSERFQGAAFTTFRRVIPPDYGDGISALRRAAAGGPLPSARLVSATVNQKTNVDSQLHTILHVTYGQFLDHDLTATPIGKDYLGGPVKCCNDLIAFLGVALKNLNDTKLAIQEIKSVEPTFGDGKTMREVEDLLHDLQAATDKLMDPKNNEPQLSALWKKLQNDLPVAQSFLPRRPFNEECAPISIPANDPFYSYHGQTCMEFVRSAPAATCSFGPREQINQHSAYLDGSVIYGVKLETTNSLRSFHNGLLKSQVTREGQRLLPASLDRNDGCNVDEKLDNGEYCFRAGDGRVNEQVLLTFFQTVWKREHNRVAKILKNFNPSWNDEKLFQESRRIVIAELQHVTYNEFLPTVLGPFVMNILSLNPLEGSEQTTDYDSGLDSSISNVFATAAYRFGHSEVQDFIIKINKHGVSSSEELSSLFFHPFSLYERDTVSNLARGGTAQPSARVDPYFSREVSGNLFKGSDPFGLDLVALNIQRGRDHGIPGYTKWRKHCGLKEVNSFGDLHASMASDDVNNLRKVYSNVHDIDLFIGGVAERPSLGGVIGPTFTCLVADQFIRIKRGDRYWYEYERSPGAFTKGQLKQLHRTTLARILCNNIPELKSIQPRPLESFGTGNKKVQCSSSVIPRYNFNPWRRRPITFPG